MKRFDRRVRAGTKVLIDVFGWCVVESVHPTRKWVKLEGFAGSFQRRHILKFTNKQHSGPKLAKQ